MTEPGGPAAAQVSTHDRRPEVCFQHQCISAARSGFADGAGAALLEDVITVRELFDEILAQYREVVGRAAGMMQARPAAEQRATPPVRAAQEG